MKKIAIKSSISAFFLTVLVDVIMYVVTIDVFDVPSRIVNLSVKYSLYGEAAASYEPPSDFLPYLLWGSYIVFLIVIYFPPTFFAYINRVRARRRILLANVFLGWTIVGWVACFFWAFSLDRDSGRGSDSDSDSDSDQAAPSPSTS